MSIIDVMFIKRFCLPKKVDLTQYKDGKRGVSNCLCGEYNHVACIIKGKYRPFNSSILCYGFNNQSTHAEEDAIHKLRPLSSKKRLQPIHMLVVRMSNTSKIQNSKPCANCIAFLRRTPQKKGYRLKNIYYSNQHGEIIKSNLKTLEAEDMHYSKSYRRRRPA